MRADIDAGALRELAAGQEVHDVMERAGGMVADNARRLSPSGPLSRSAQEGIVSQPVLTPDGWSAQIGHVTGEYGFHLARRELGTRYQRPQPHLRPAASQPIDL